MRIAICDHDAVSSKFIKNATYAYADSHRLEMVIDSYTSGEELLKSRIPYQLVLIEYDLKGLNGLETAKLLKRTFFHATIMFLGQYSDFILRTFEVNPRRVLLKPISQRDLYAALDEYFLDPICRPLWIKCGYDIVCVNIGDVLYLEADNKHCHVCLKNKKVPCHKTMAHIFGGLPKNLFLKINRAHVVNLTHVKGYNKNSVRLTNGEALPLTKNYYPGFQNGFAAFADPIII